MIVRSALTAFMVAAAAVTPASATTFVFDVTTSGGDAPFELRLNLTSFVTAPVIIYSPSGFSYQIANAYADTSLSSTPYTQEALQAGGFSNYSGAGSRMQVYAPTMDGSVVGSSALQIDFTASANSYRDYLNGGPAFYYRYSQMDLFSQGLTSFLASDSLTLERLTEIFAESDFRYNEFGSNSLCQSEQDPQCASVSSFGISGVARFARIEGAAVPEPGTWAMMLLGFAGVGVAIRRKRPDRQLSF